MSSSIAQKSKGGEGEAGLSEDFHKLNLGQQQPQNVMNKQVNMDAVPNATTNIATTSASASAAAMAASQVLKAAQAQAQTKLSNNNEIVNGESSSISRIQDALNYTNASSNNNKQKTNNAISSSTATNTTLTTALQDNNHHEVNTKQEEEESSEISASDEDGSWISWFCSLRGNEFFCEVDEDYIQDDFNLTGLNIIVPYYDYALDMVLDVEMPMEEQLTEHQQEIVESAAVSFVRTIISYTR